MHGLSCTRCGKDNPAGCRLCTGCGELLRPLYLDSQPGANEVICQVCGSRNDKNAATCWKCGSALPGATRPVVGGGEGSDQGRGGRISLQPENQAEPPAGGSRLSRLAQARRQKEAAEGGSRSESADWLGSLRSDAPPPADYATRMDEDDEADPNLRQALQQMRQEEGGEAEAPGLPFDLGAEAAPPSFSRAVPPPPAFGEPLPTFPAFEERQPNPPSFEERLPQTPPAFGERLSQPPAPATPTPPPANPSGSFNLPGGLNLDDLLAGTPAESAAPETPANPPIGAMGEDTSLPDWLQKGTSGLPAPKAPPVENVPSSEVPDWLQELTGGSHSNNEPPAAPFGMSSDDSGEVPDWLRDAGAAAPKSPGSLPLNSEPSRELPDWLKRATDSLPSPSQPTFGDVDVEQRLKFAFDESSRPSRGSDSEPSDSGFVFGSSQQHTGLTDLLGLPPLSGDATIPPASSFDQSFDAALPPLPDFPASNTGSNAGLGDLPPLPGLDFGTPVSNAAALPDLPPLPDFASPAQPAAGLPALPDFLATPAEANADTGLAPWLRGLEMPTLDAPAIGSRESGTGTLPPLPFDILGGAEAAHEPAFDLAPWLQGLPLPTVGEEAAELPDFLRGDVPTAQVENPPIQSDVTTDTRSFSVRDMLRATDDLADDFLQEAVLKAGDFSSPPEELAASALDLPDAPANQTGELPDWLKGVSTHPSSPLDLPLPPLPGDEEEPEVEPTPFVLPSFDGPEAPPQPRPLSNMAGGPVDFELPDFLALPADQPVPQPATSAPELPDFLKENGSATPAPDFLSGERSANDLPDFLSGAQPANDLPDFLNTEQSANDLPDFLGGGQPSNDLPDFLSGFGNEPAAAPSYGFDQERDQTAEPSFSFNTQESPVPSFDFLNQEADQSAQPNFLAAMGATGEPAELPDFLRDAGVSHQEEPAPFGTASDTSGDHSLDFLRAEAGATAATPEAEPEMPDWLKNLSAGGPLPAVAPKAPTGYTPMATGSSEGPGTSELPEWLREDIPSEPSRAFYEPEPILPDFAQAVQTPEEPQFDSQTRPVAVNFDEEAGFDSRTRPVAVNFDEEFDSRTRPVAVNLDSDEIPAPASFQGFEMTPAAHDFNPFAEQAAESPALADLPLPGTDDLSSARLPDWLSEQNQASAEALPDFSLPEGGELPEWLAEEPAANPLAAIDDLTAEPATPGPQYPLPPAGAASSAEFDSLLGDIGSAESPAFNDTNFLGDIDGPAWLRGGTQPPKPDTGPLRPPGTSTLPNTPAGGEPGLPSWLRSVAPAAVEEPTEEPASLSAMSLPTGEPVLGNLPQVRLPAQLASAAVLTTLLAPAAVTTAVVTEKPGRMPLKLTGAAWLRYGLSILLLLAALLGLSANILPAGQSLVVSPNVQSYFDALDTLGPNSKVLVAYDWEADRSGEMLPMAKTLTAHIMRQRARLLTFSLNPQGPALAEQVTEPLASANNNQYEYGQGYLNLGWRAGQEVALRSLLTGNLGLLTDYKQSQPVTSYATMQGINGLSDFDLIIVLAGDEGSVRSWIEQVGVQPGVQLMLATPQAVEPLARPYALGPDTASQDVSTKLVRANGLIAGLSQAAQYNQLLVNKYNLSGDTAIDPTRRLGAQTLAALLLALAVIVANIVYFVQRRR